MSQRNFDRETVLEAINGSGGIVSAIAKSLGCAWHTAETYVNKWESTKQAFAAEGETILDKAESLIERNITLGLRTQQQQQRTVDSADAKWLLARKGKHRGYAERHEIGGTGEKGEIVIDDARAEYHSRALATLADALGGILARRGDGGDDAMDAAE
jgi:hypothetical protein